MTEDPMLSDEQIKELARLKKRWPNTTFTYVTTRSGKPALMIVASGKHRS